MSNKYDGYGWIKVKKYRMDSSLSWEERYYQLDAHHVEETTFLIEEVRRLAKIVDEQRRDLNRHGVSAAIQRDKDMEANLDRRFN